MKGNDDYQAIIKRLGLDEEMLKVFALFGAAAQAEHQAPPADVPPQQIDSKPGLKPGKPVEWTPDHILDILHDLRCLSAGHIRKGTSVSYTKSLDEMLHVCLDNAIRCEGRDVDRQMYWLRCAMLAQDELRRR